MKHYLLNISSFQLSFSIKFFFQLMLVYTCINLGVQYIKKLSIYYFFRSSRTRSNGPNIDFEKHIFLINCLLIKVKFPTTTGVFNALKLCVQVQMYLAATKICILHIKYARYKQKAQRFLFVSVYKYTLKNAGKWPN